MQHLFRQIHHHIRTVLILTLPKRTDAGVGVLDVLLLLEVSEVFAVADGHAVVLTTALVENGGKVIKLPLATEGVNDGALLPEQKRP